MARKNHSVSDSSHPSEQSGVRAKSHPPSSKGEGSRQRATLMLAHQAAARSRALQALPESNTPSSQPPVSQNEAEHESVSGMIRSTQRYLEECKKEARKIRPVRKSIKRWLAREWNTQERTEAFAEIYDIFSATIDEHMAQRTGGYPGHYGAIRRCLANAKRHLRLPIADLTAGTGEPIRYAIQEIQKTYFAVLGFASLYPDASLHHDDETGVWTKVKKTARKDLDLTEQERMILTLLGDSFTHDIEHMAPADLNEEGTGMEAEPFDDDGHLVLINEVSRLSLEKARSKLKPYERDLGVLFSNRSAYELPKEYYGRFRTVLSGQIFHLLREEDRLEMIRAMREMLEIGGMAIVIEEDPFRITNSASISQFIRLYIESFASSPIQDKGDLIGLFTSNGFRLHALSERFSVPIDQFHRMRLYEFEKR